jgi:hypothetical protein
MPSPLVRATLTAARHRLRGPGLAATVGLAALALAVLAGAASLGARLFDGVDADALPHAVRAATFWFNTAAALVYSFTVFEGIYRSRGQRLRVVLPVDPAQWFQATALAALLAHAPLLLLALCLFAPLLTSAEPALFGFAIASVGLVFAAGLPFALALHLKAGQSLLAGPTALKASLTQGLVAAEAALLFYAPALALAGILVVSLGIEVLLRLWWEVQGPAPLGIAIGASLAVAVASLRAGRAAFDGSFATVLARFWETEIVSPFADDHLPRPPWALGLLDGTRCAALFRRDLVQLRRRHRLDGALTALAAVATGLAAARTTSPPGWQDPWLVLVLALLTVLDPAGRLAGPELENRWTLRTLPLSSWAPLVSKLAAAGVVQAPAIALGAVAAALGSGSLVTGGVVLCASVATALPYQAASLAVGLRALPGGAAARWSVRLLTSAAALFAASIA